MISFKPLVEPRSHALPGLALWRGLAWTQDTYYILGTEQHVQPRPVVSTTDQHKGNGGSRAYNEVDNPVQACLPVLNNKVYLTH